MASFKTVLDDIGNGLKKFFTSPITAEVAETGISVAEIAFPALTPLLQGVGKSIAVAQGLAAQAIPSGASLEQVTAIVLADAQQVFQEYQTATGTTIETAQQKAIIAQFLALLAAIPKTPTSA